ncbi:conserved hypothetical protein [Leishmania major strain Friedlin]|uniref:Uncharacterized protein n=1 Tax=Leishmania major TaxID=5664 RepID=Q4Q7H7_LEIMA|nr:conserved hypothetical protein [Leishmania major strain Friedlin]CAG9578323.1 hypothetical_protein_-_conserved [Leishmania major strain Friedlin]CAJ06192.1 conserved hypothetical protein [Leishmania major strain Friedlin]|eukprot:XP_001684721.1 conserved hypothetical protein [Leishmania major strain Friedlin]
MPLPSAVSFTQAKWLAFFAELTAKLTHHNALVVMEGAELLKRLLLSRVSIAAVLQQGDLLVRLLDTWRGCVLAEHPSKFLHHDDRNSSAFPAPPPPPPSAAVALNDELSFVLAESISQCIDLMVSLYADGDPYYSLLVLARAGPMLEVLVDVIRMAPSQIYGITASLLQQLLALPLGRDSIGSACVGDVADGARGEGAQLGFDRATLAQLRKSIPLQKHVRSLVEAIQGHGVLLQYAADTLVELLAGQQGPRRFAAIALFNQASKRLRKHQLRRGGASSAAASAPGGDATPGIPPQSRCDARESTVNDSDLNVTITGAAPAHRPSPSPSPSPGAVAPCALDDLERGLQSPAKHRHGGAAVPLGEAEEAGGAAAARGGVSLARDAAQFPSLPAANPAADSDKPPAPPSQPNDISAMVDAEPQRLVCAVPLTVAEEALRHLASSRSHDEFFAAFDWLWCLTVADAPVVGAALTPEMLRRSLGRYLTAAPQTRRDRILFTLLLLWIGHVHSVSALREETHSCVLEVAASALLPMLRTELAKDGERASPGQACGSSNKQGISSLTVSAITPTNTNIAATTSATMLSTQETAGPLGYGDIGSDPTVAGLSLDPSLFRRGERRDNGSYPSAIGSALLPYAAARKAQEAAVLLRPSIGVILLSFLLNIHAGAAVHAQRVWVSQGRVLEVAQMAIRRAQGCRSALLDTPTTIDGALSDEVYLEYALRSVRTDATTVAVLGCRLVAAVLGDELRWGAAARDSSTAKPAPTEKVRGEGNTAAALMQAELAVSAQSLIPLLVDMAANNPDVTAAQESGAASPVHHVPLNLRCSRYTSLGECSLVALDACLQYHAQAGHLRSRGDVPMSVSGFAIEDLVRVLPSLTCVSQCSVHPPVRAVPYRLLLYVSQRLEEVLVVLRHMPSLASAAVSCVLDYGPRAAQWEAAAAAEWLTVLVDLLIGAETAKQTAAPSCEGKPPSPSQQRRRLPTAAELLNEYFHFDDTPLSRKLLLTIASGRRNTSTGSAYAVNALLQLATHLQTYLQARSRKPQQSSPAVLSSVTREAAAVKEAVTLPLCPPGAPSLAQWVLLLQSITADNRRLTRICSAFKHPIGGGHSVLRRGSGGVTKDACTRAVTAAEQIALQYNFTGTVFRALESLLCDAASGVSAASLSSWLLCDAAAAALMLPTPSDVVALVSTRFQAARAPEAGDGDAAYLPPSWIPSPALVFSYQAAIQWASRVGASWLTGSYGAAAHAEVGASNRTRGHGGLPLKHGCTGLVEDICTGALRAMQEMTPSVSQRTRCLAATLVSAVVDACPVEQLGVLEAHGAALFATSVTLRRLPCVSGLQCRLLRRVRSAAVHAATSSDGWLEESLTSLRRVVDRLQENAQLPPSSAKNGGHSSHRRLSYQPHDAAQAVRELQNFQVLVSLLTSLVSCTGATRADGAARASSPTTEDEMSSPTQRQLLLTDAQRQTLCAALCDALRVHQLQPTVVLAVRSMADTHEGRRCILTEIASTGDPLGRTLFGRLMALTLHMPSRWVGADSAAGTRSSSRAFSPTSTPQDRHRGLKSSPSQQRLPSITGAAATAASSASPPLRSPPHGETPQPADRDIVCVVGCDVCTMLCGSRSQEGVGGAKPLADAGPSSAPTSTVFLSAFVKHRGVEFLARAVVESDRELRRHGRDLTVPLHWLRLVAALSLHLSIAKPFVQHSDFFSVLMELAGTPASALHARAATLALLAIRNVCFADGLKSTLCQDARVLLTLKAAGMGITAVSQLIEWRPPPLPPPNSKRSRTAARPTVMGGAPPLTSRGGARLEVMLREDVIDMENKTEVDWAKQACVYARGMTRLGEEPLPTIDDPASCDATGDVVAAEGKPPSAAPGGASGADHVVAAPLPRRLFGDITNHSRAADAGGSLLEIDATVSGGSPAKQVEDTMLPVLVAATDSEAHLRRYLAATAIASLWFDNQRGRSAIARVLAATPCWSMEDVQAAIKASVAPTMGAQVS